MREGGGDDHYHAERTPGGVTRDARDLCPVQCPRLVGIQGTGSVPELLPGMAHSVSRDTQKSRIAEPFASQVAHVPERRAHSRSREDALSGVLWHCGGGGRSAVNLVFP